mmetsp:Transcript_61183/g.71552  ORF Transcript_61183/g.71552 Transcript_61183/m.71552 type:complete len:138 (+) Transcript_61183:51-464(+)
MLILTLCIVIFIPPAHTFVESFQGQPRQSFFKRRTYNQQCKIQAKTFEIGRLILPCKLKFTTSAHTVWDAALSISSSKDNNEVLGEVEKSKIKSNLNRNFFSIAAPALIQLAAEPLASLVDTAYLGRLGVKLPFIHN